MKVLKKLIAVRNELAHLPLNKSGHNKFAGYKYFELGDFLPSVQMLFEKHGLCDVICFNEDLATMTIHDVEDNIGQHESRKVAPRGPRRCVTIHGKDEVIGSIPIKGSMKPRSL